MARLGLLLAMRVSSSALGILFPSWAYSQQQAQPVGVLDNISDLGTDASIELFRKDFVGNSNGEEIKQYDPLFAGDLLVVRYMSVNLILCNQPRSYDYRQKAGPPLVIRACFVQDPPPSRATPQTGGQASVPMGLDRVYANHKNAPPSGEFVQAAETATTNLGDRMVEFAYGDSLERLADYFGVALEAVRERNGFAEGHDPIQGQIVRIPLVSTSKMNWPMHGETRQGQDPRAGLTFADAKGAAVWAASGGVVSDVIPKGQDRYVVEVDHINGYKSQYHGLELPLLKQGDLVEDNSLLGKVGDEQFDFKVLQGVELVDPRRVLSAMP